MDLKGKIAVVTGASRGLGQRVALTLASHGAQVALVARNQPQLDATVQLISDQYAANGGRGYAFVADMGDITAVTNLKPQIERTLGNPAILINAAGVFGPIQLVKDSDPDQWIATQTINLISPYLLCRAFVGSMIAQGWGRIVNFTSAASLHPPGALNSAYGTSKAAINQFTRHLASELVDTGVTANVIHPGDVKTEMWADIRAKLELLPAGASNGYREWVQWVDQTGGDDPQKAADLILALMSDTAASTNGQFLWIENGLQAPVPSWGDPSNTQPWRE